MKKLLSILLLSFCFSATAQNASSIKQLLEEGVTVGELLDAGVAPNEFYGVEYEGGLIFDIDSSIGIGKVVAIYNGPSIRTGSINDISVGSYPYVETQDDGLLNTELLSEVYDNSVYDVAMSFIHKGYSDWYIPSVNEAFKIADSYMNLKFRDESGQELINNWANIVTSEFETSQDVLTINSLTTSPNTNVEYISSQLYPKFIRQFNVDSLSNPGSPALQSFLETYTPPLVEEEVVSDANSFDVLNPLSYNGEFEAVHHDFTNGNYVVPQGKTLIVNHIFGENNSNSVAYVNGIRLAIIYGYTNDQENSISNLVLSSSETLSILIDDPSKQVTFHGVLINKNVETVHHDFTNGGYVVPNGKSLVINQFFTSPYSNPSAYINGVLISKIQANANDGPNSINNLLLSESDLIDVSESGGGDNNTTFHGILIDNSNYTFATDYELIDALNEGIDSLSTMSEMVVLENDSISSQNAILSQENEALMAIDYNFDSLQYVADFLSSQVFELQQELLVPNIDVDMAIGWNMVGFSCPQQKTAEDALLSIVDEIIIFKDNSGNVYMPEFSFNGIGDLTPGHGYQLKVTDYILDFNICE